MRSGFRLSDFCRYALGSSSPVPPAEEALRQCCLGAESPRQLAALASWEAPGAQGGAEKEFPASQGGRRERRAGSAISAPA
eukprot:scaffold119609_cov23-Prasinocladus_malaysianus.AAC.1